MERSKVTLRDEDVVRGENGQTGELKENSPVDGDYQLIQTTLPEPEPLRSS